MRSFRYKSLLLLTTLIVLGIFSTQKASAHFPASDGSITAELHIEPGDNPTPGKPVTFNLIIFDASNHFRVSKCSCNLSVSQSGNILYYSPLTAPSDDKPTIYSTAGLPFTFPSVGSYDVVANGRPGVTGSFEPFNLSWHLRVNRSSMPEQSSSIKTFIVYFLLILGLFSLLGIALFIFN